MSLSPITSTDPSNAANTADASSSSSSSSVNSLGENDFLTLLTAQLSNQDPLNPMDNSQFVAQLAQFSSVEQLTTANTNLNQLLVGQASQNQVADASLVGKDVLYQTNSVSLTSGQPTQLLANFASAPAQVTAVITNSSGQTVRTLSFGAEPAGQTSLPWDGLDSNGNQLPSGTYNVQITATDSSGQPVTVTQEARSLVSGVSFTNGYPQLVVDTGIIDLSSISEIDQAS